MINEKTPIIGRFSGRVILGNVDGGMAEAARKIDRDAAAVATAMRIIHGEQYHVLVDHEVGFVMVVRLS